MTTKLLKDDREIGIVMFALEFLKANLDDDLDEIFCESDLTVGDYPPTEDEIASLMQSIEHVDPLPFSPFLSPADYARFGGRFCPVCLHHTVEYGDVVSGGLPSIEQQASCATCGAAWQEQNKLTGYVDLEYPPSPPHGSISRVGAVVVVANSDGEETSFPTEFLVRHQYGNLDEAAILRFARDIVGFVRIQEHTLTEVL